MQKWLTWGYRQNLIDSSATLHDQDCTRYLLWSMCSSFQVLCSYRLEWVPATRSAASEIGSSTLLTGLGHCIAENMIDLDDKDLGSNPYLANEIHLVAWAQ